MTETEIKAKAWDNLMDFFRGRGICLSYRDAVAATGGTAHLSCLLADGKIVEVDGKGTSANSKRLFPADQVYSYVRTRAHKKM